MWLILVLKISYWVSRQTGVIWKSNQALQAEVEIRILDTVGEGNNLWVVFSTYTVASYVLSLRENKGVILDLQGINETWKNNDGTYILVALLV